MRYYLSKKYICFAIQESIKNGVYNLMVDNLYLKSFKKKLFLSKDSKYPNIFFRIRINSTTNDNLYYIETLNTHKKLGIFKNKSIIIGEEKNELQLWNFLNITNHTFAIRNKGYCFLTIKNSKLFCETINLYKATKFKFIRVYSEVEKENKLMNLQLLKNEPIDILIKYIDLNDPNLNRSGIHQIEKDYDNEELRYSIRSILKNLPWVRKIFILMPNEKVRYFKEYNLINEKIIYVKDKDLLGYESSNPRAFQFRYWKMKKFGISNNIIVMDDDYFIGKKLKKSDFFYVKDGKVVPSIITSNFIRINKLSVTKIREYFKIKAKTSKEEQNGDIFDYCRYSTYSFILNIFNISINNSVFIPLFTHNAIPINLEDVKEIYDLIYMSNYKYSTLDSLYRNIEGLQFEISILSYSFLKYDRLINNIPANFIKLNNSIFGNYNFSLFCINKGAGNYSNLKLYQAKIIMEYLFPNPSPYELIDFSSLNLPFNIINPLKEKIKLYEEKEKIFIIMKKELLFNEIYLIIILVIIVFKYNKQN